MQLLKSLTDTIADFLQPASQAWWVEITTQNPPCCYYFGPFSERAEAEGAYEGYVEDLKNERAEGIQVNIKRCQPEQLTIFKDE